MSGPVIRQFVANLPSDLVPDDDARAEVEAALRAVDSDGDGTIGTAELRTAEQRIVLLPGGYRLLGLFRTHRPKPEPRRFHLEFESIAKSAFLPGDREAKIEDLTTKLYINFSNRYSDYATSDQGPLIRPRMGQYLRALEVVDSRIIDYLDKQRMYQLFVSSILRPNFMPFDEAIDAYFINLYTHYSEWGLQGIIDSAGVPVQMVRDKEYSISVLPLSAEAQRYFYYQVRPGTAEARGGITYELRFKGRAFGLSRNPRISSFGYLMTSKGIRIVQNQSGDNFGDMVNPIALDKLEASIDGRTKKVLNLVQQYLTKNQRLNQWWANFVVGKLKQDYPDTTLYYLQGRAQEWLYDGDIPIDVDVLSGIGLHAISYSGEWGKIDQLKEQMQIEAQRLESEIASRRSSPDTASHLPQLEARLTRVKIYLERIETSLKRIHAYDQVPQSLGFVKPGSDQEAWYQLERLPTPTHIPPEQGMETDLARDTGRVARGREAQMSAWLRGILGVDEEPTLPTQVVSALRVAAPTPSVVPIQVPAESISVTTNTAQDGRLLVEVSVLFGTRLDRSFFDNAFAKVNQEINQLKTDEPDARYEVIFIFDMPYGALMSDSTMRRHARESLSLNNPDGSINRLSLKVKTHHQYYIWSTGESDFKQAGQMSKVDRALDVIGALENAKRVKARKRIEEINQVVAHIQKLSEDHESKQAAETHESLVEIHRDIITKLSLHVTEDPTFLDYKAGFEQLVHNINSKLATRLEIISRFNDILQKSSGMKAAIKGLSSQVLGASGDELDQVLREINGTKDDLEANLQELKDQKTILANLNTALKKDKSDLTKLIRIINKYFTSQADSARRDQQAQKVQAQAARLAEKQQRQLAREAQKVQAQADRLAEKQQRQLAREAQTAQAQADRLAEKQQRQLAREAQKAQAQAARFAQEQQRQLAREAKNAEREAQRAERKADAEFKRGQQRIQRIGATASASEGLNQQLLPVKVYPTYDQMLLQAQGNEDAFKNLMLQNYGTSVGLFIQKRINELQILKTHYQASISEKRGVNVSLLTLNKLLQSQPDSLDRKTLDPLLVRAAAEAIDIDANAFFYLYNRHYAPNIDARWTRVGQGEYYLETKGQIGLLERLAKEFENIEEATIPRRIFQKMISPDDPLRDVDGQITVGEQTIGGKLVQSYIFDKETTTQSKKLRLLAQYFGGEFEDYFDYMLDKLVPGLRARLSDILVDARYAALLNLCDERQRLRLSFNLTFDDINDVRIIKDKMGLVLWLTRRLLNINRSVAAQRMQMSYETYAYLESGTARDAGKANSNWMHKPKVIGQIKTLTGLNEEVIKDLIQEAYPLDEVSVFDEKPDYLTLRAQATDTNQLSELITQNYGLTLVGAVRQYLDETGKTVHALKVDLNKHLKDSKMNQKTIQAFLVDDHTARNRPVERYILNAFAKALGIDINIVYYLHNRSVLPDVDPEWTSDESSVYYIERQTFTALAKELNAKYPKDNSQKTSSRDVALRLFRRVLNEPAEPFMNNHGGEEYLIRNAIRPFLLGEVVEPHYLTLFAAIAGGSRLDYYAFMLDQALPGLRDKINTLLAVEAYKSLVPENLLSENPKEGYYFDIDKRAASWANMYLKEDANNPSLGFILWIHRLLRSQTLDDARASLSIGSSKYSQLEKNEAESWVVAQDLVDKIVALTGLDRSLVIRLIKQTYPQFEQEMNSIDYDARVGEALPEIRQYNFESLPTYNDLRQASTDPNDFDRLMQEHYGQGISYIIEARIKNLELSEAEFKVRLEEHGVYSPIILNRVRDPNLVVETYTPDRRLIKALAIVLSLDEQALYYLINRQLAPGTDSRWTRTDAEELYLPTSSRIRLLNELNTKYSPLQNVPRRIFQKMLDPTTPFMDAGHEITVEGGRFRGILLDRYLLEETVTRADMLGLIAQYAGGDRQEYFDFMLDKLVPALRDKIRVLLDNSDYQPLLDLLSSKGMNPDQFILELDGRHIDPIKKIIARNDELAFVLWVFRQFKGVGWNTSKMGQTVGLVKDYSYLENGMARSGDKDANWMYDSKVISRLSQVTGLAENVINRLMLQTYPLIEVSEQEEAQPDYNQLINRSSNETEFSTLVSRYYGTSPGKLIASAMKKYSMTLAGLSKRLKENYGLAVNEDTIKSITSDELLELKTRSYSVDTLSSICRELEIDENIIFFMLNRHFIRNARKSNSVETQGELLLPDNRWTRAQGKEHLLRTKAHVDLLWFLHGKYSINDRVPFELFHRIIRVDDPLMSNDQLISSEDGQLTGKTIFQFLQDSERLAYPANLRKIARYVRGDSGDYQDYFDFMLDKVIPELRLRLQSILSQSKYQGLFAIEGAAGMNGGGFSFSMSTEDLANVRRILNQQGNLSLVLWLARRFHNVTIRDVPRFSRISETEYKQLENNQANPIWIRSDGTIEKLLDFTKLTRETIIELIDSTYPSAESDRAITIMGEEPEDTMTGFRPITIATIGSSEKPIAEVSPAEAPSDIDPHPTWSALLGSAREWLVGQTMEEDIKNELLARLSLIEDDAEFKASAWRKFQELMGDDLITASNAHVVAFLASGIFKEGQNPLELTGPAFVNVISRMPVFARPAVGVGVRR